MNFARFARDFANDPKSMVIVLSGTIVNGLFFKPPVSVVVGCILFAASVVGLIGATGNALKPRKPQ